MDEVTAEAFINALQFKVELKSFMKPAKGAGVVLWFVLPENPAIDMDSVDMRET